VGKTSLVHRYVLNKYSPSTTLSTIGASFLTKRAVDVDSGTPVRLQIWDTAGQERFRSISKLYYRGASAVVLVYSIIDAQSFEEMGRWLQEVKQNCGDDIIVHVVGTKSDIVSQDPSLREVPFERCIAYVAENLYPSQAFTPPPSAGSPPPVHSFMDSKRNSGFWTMDAGWDVCHEISASSGEGIEEVFRVITRKLVDRAHEKLEELAAAERTPAAQFDTGAGYFDRPRTDYNTGSFRLGVGDKRRSWLGALTPSIGVEEEQVIGAGDGQKKQGGRCC
jgi:small GTP-binding protein